MKPVAPPPHRVVTLPPGEILRSFLLLKSATYTSPDAGNTARPLGELKRAFVPTASMAPEKSPASGLTTPPGVTVRTKWVLVSLRMMKPLPLTATPWGEVTIAASEDTTPAGVTIRSRLLPESATTKKPLGSTAENAGEENLAALPGPSTLPAESH
jgi:hypothetical protein